ncbi:MAG: copper oxidase [Chloroflexi bacterium RBG_16_54_11]|nr:MAG: copper oxidase [Chloroflexi bacterium RBG_16_54_11]
MTGQLSRRDFLKAGGLTLLGTAGVAALSQVNAPAKAAMEMHPNHHPTDAMAMPVGEVDPGYNGFNPSEILTDFDYGKVSTLSDGRTLREYDFIVNEKDIEIMPGIFFSAWTYNGRIPGPSIRVTEGDLVRVHLHNESSHPHSMHFHGVHPAEMDGVPGTPGLIEPGQSFTYEFDAEPFGLHLYHCHASPLARHIAKGLYGVFIIDPKSGRPPVDREMVMVMSGFDVDFDDGNDFYAVNAIPFHYQLNPIQIKVGEVVRIYLVNILEFDLINSFHIHANFFHYYPTGTSLTPSEYTDTVMQTQAQRGILEFSYKYPGLYMFHAHNTEFAELGWTGYFEVVP